MPTSTISAARAALYDLLVAAAPASATVPTERVQIAFGPPAHEDLEVVALLGVRAPDEDVQSLGSRRRTEEYVLEVGVKVHDPAAGDSIAGRKSCDARGFYLSDWVRSVVHGHWTLNGTVRTAFVRNQETDGVQPTADGGCLIFFLITVECSADITDATSAP